MKKFLAIALCIAFTTPAWAAPSCMSDANLMASAALIQKEGRGKGSAVLYQDDIVITNHHVISDIGENIWVYIPKIDKQIKAKVLYATPKPDLAILKLEQPVPDARKITLARGAEKRESMKLVSFPFGERHRLGAVHARFNNMARFTSDTRLLYFNALLADWAFAGDSGGGFYNCKGQLVGINFGNLALKGTPEHVYGVNMRAVQDALNTAGVEVRMSY